MDKEKIEQDSNELSIWKVEIKTMSLVDFSIDFTGSTDISFVDSNNNNMQCQFQINPFEIKEIAKIILTPNSKVKAKFKIELNVPDKEFQKQFLEKELTSNQQILNECKQKFTNNNFEFIPNNEIENTLNKNQIHKYIDYEVPPNDESFGGNASEFDYIIHFLTNILFVFFSKVNLFIDNNTRYRLALCIWNNCCFSIFQKQAYFFEFAFHKFDNLFFIKVARKSHII